MSTAPFTAEVAELVKGVHESRVSARAVVAGQTLELDLEDYTIDWTERRTPRVSAELVCPIPDEADLALLDPRTYVRVIITAAYRLPSGTWDSHDVATLMLRARRVDRPTDTMSLTCASHESAVIDNTQNTNHPNDVNPVSAPTSEVVPSGSAWVATALEDHLYELIHGPAPDLTVVDNVHTGEVDVLGLAANDRWDAFDAVAQMQGFDVFDNGDATLRLERLPALSAVTSHALTVGAAGTIEESSAAIDRDDWANYVRLRFHKTIPDGAGGTKDAWVYGQAYVTAGPYAPAAAGWKSLVEDREGRPSQNYANRAAATLLERMLSRSRSLTLRAVAAWWLRAGDTVTVQLPTGAQERHLVVGVVFRADDTMTVVTRLPDSVSTIGA